MLVFAMDLFALGLSTILVKLVFGTMLRRIPAYTRTDYLQFIFMLVIAFMVAFSCFNQDTDIVRLGWKMELLRVVEYNAILATTLAFLLIVFKASVLDSRYLYLGIFAVNVPLTCLSHSILKNYLRSNHSAHIKKLVGVLSTKDRVEPMVRDLQRDWSKNVIGVALVDAAASERTKKDIRDACRYAQVEMLELPAHALGDAIGKPWRMCAADCASLFVQFLLPLVCGKIFFAD